MGSLTQAAEEGTAAAVDWSDEAVIYVNGVRRVLPDGLAHLTLLQYLRGRPSPSTLSTLYVSHLHVSMLRPLAGVLYS